MTSPDSDATQPPPFDPNALPPKLKRVYDAARRMAAARHRAILWANTAKALADHKPKEPEAK